MLGPTGVGGRVRQEPGRASVGATEPESPCCLASAPRCECGFCPPQFGGVDADEAVVGLMARRNFNDPSVFFWEQAYGGSQESFLAALSLAIGGTTTLRSEVGSCSSLGSCRCLRLAGGQENSRRPCSCVGSSDVLGNTVCLRLNEHQGAGVLRHDHDLRTRRDDVLATSGQRVRSGLEVGRSPWIRKASGHGPAPRWRTSSSPPWAGR